MSDKEDNAGTVDETPMAEPDQNRQLQEDQEQVPPQDEIKKPEKTSSNVSFSIWPPSQRTRDAVINRLVETLSAPSVLSKRYGSMPHDEASSIARLIEIESFAASSVTASAGDDGVEILQAYSREISKRMLDAVKTRSAPSSASTPDHNASSQTPPVATPAASEEIPSVEAES